MNELHKRIALYGGATVALGALVAAMQLAPRDADVMTLLSSADVHLRMANAMPVADKSGAPLSERVRIIAEAEASLAIVERLEPGLASTAEFRGFAHSLRGQFAEAAACYQRARQCSDVQAEQADVLAFNQARMLAKAGQLEQALAAFAAAGKALDSRFGPQRTFEECAILDQLGRRDEAVARLGAVVASGSLTPMASLQAGFVYRDLGRLDAAETQFQRAATEIPVADYHRAQLKLQRGEVDSGLELLGRAAKAQPAEVRRLLRIDADAWSAVAADARFQEISRPVAATPVR
jgi:tetratricopeptide (TPR) repeat protein